MTITGAAGLTACGPDSRSSSSSVETSIRLEGLNGGDPLSLDDIETPTVINMWATWCGPCRKEMPHFDEVADDLAGRVRIVGANTGEDETAASQFLAENNITFDQVLDPDGQLSEHFEVTGLPGTAFLDADGRVIEVHSGALAKDELLERIEMHFGVS